MKGGVIVEKVSDEGQIELIDAIDNVLGRQKAAAAELIRLLEHQLGSTQQIVLLHKTKMNFQEVTKGDRCVEGGGGVKQR
jgi:hypothetical protein